MKKNFWEEKTLTEMTKQEWESLCDGCAKCCLIKLEDIDTAKVYYSKVVCKLMDQNTCQCTNYQERSTIVSDCVWLTPKDIDQFHWLPSTCAYRLLAEGKSLEWWHPLISGDPATVHEAGVSIRGRCISEEHVHPNGYEEHLITWVE